jgi:hypothetical protein
MPPRDVKPLRAGRPVNFRREETMLIERLKSVDTDRCDIDELVELCALGRTFRAEYEQVGVEVPEWLDANLKSLRREVRARVADSLDKTLREKKARLEALTPAEEKRSKLAAEIAALEQKLAGQPA